MTKIISRLSVIIGLIWIFAGIFGSYLFKDASFNTSSLLGFFIIEVLIISIGLTLIITGITYQTNKDYLTKKVLSINKKKLAEIIISLGVAISLTSFISGFLIKSINNLLSLILPALISAIGLILIIIGVICAQNIDVFLAHEQKKLTLKEAGSNSWGMTDCFLFIWMVYGIIYGFRLAIPRLTSIDIAFIFFPIIALIAGRVGALLDIKH